MTLNATFKEARACSEKGGKRIGGRRGRRKRSAENRKLREKKI